MDKIEIIYADYFEISGYTCTWEIVKKDKRYIAHMFLRNEAQTHYSSLDLGTYISPTIAGNMMARLLIELLDATREAELRTKLKKSDNTRIH